MDKETALKWLEHCLIVEGACTGCPCDPSGKMDFKDCKRILFDNISALVNDSVPVLCCNCIYWGGERTRRCVKLDFPANKDDYCAFGAKKGESEK